VGPRIVLADENAVFLGSLRQALEGECQVLATACDGATVLKLLEELAPDVVLMSLAMRTSSGSDLTRDTTGVLGNIKVIVLTMHTDPAYVQEALKGGASGVLLKSSARAEVVAAIHHVMAGGTYVGTGLGLPGAGDFRPPS